MAKNVLIQIYHLGAFSVFLNTNGKTYFQKDEFINIYDLDEDMSIITLVKPDFFGIREKKNYTVSHFQISLAKNDLILVNMILKRNILYSIYNDLEDPNTMFFEKLNTVLESAPNHLEMFKILLQSRIISLKDRDTISSESIRVISMVNQQEDYQKRIQNKRKSHL